MKKFVSVILGIVLGIAAVGGVSVYAKTYIDNVYWNKDVIVMFNGMARVLPMDYVVMNYMNYNYTSARFVAEGLGAKVDYDDETNTIIIDTVPPETVYEVSEDTDIFIEAPAGFKNDYIELVVNGVELGRYPQAFLTVTKTKGSVEYLYKDAYIEYEGERYPINQDYSNQMEEQRMARAEKTISFMFERINQVVDDEVTVCIPIKVRDVGETITEEMVFNIKLTTPELK